MNIFTQIIVVVGKITPNGVSMLGSGFIVTNDCKIVTTPHIVGDSDKELVVLAPHIKDINEYQDTMDARCQPTPAKIIEIDPIKDLAIIKIDANYKGDLPKLGSFDEVKISEQVGIFGFPHCIEGRRVLTFQEAEIGAKILLQSNNIKTKHAVINSQTRPGQSGSLIFSNRLSKIVGILIGAYIPAGGGISLGGVNPRELHQTIQCISAEYVKEM